MNFMCNKQDQHLPEKNFIIILMEREDYIVRVETEPGTRMEIIVGVQMEITVGVLMEIIVGIISMVEKGAFGTLLHGGTPP